MLTEKNYRDFCDEETENELVKLGFPIEHACLQGSGIYVTIHISLYEAQKWLREEKRIEVVVLGEKEIGGPYYADIYTKSGYAGYVHKPCEKYEEALSEGIKAAVKILKEEE